MGRSDKGGIALVALASLFWAVSYSVLSRLTQEGIPPLVVEFHLLLWAAVAALLLLVVTGRADELWAFQRQETHFLVLVATGGYGFWLFQALALRRLDPTTAHLAFYVGPLMAGVILAFQGKATPRKHLVALLWAFVGAIIIFRDPARYSTPAGGTAALWSRGYGAAAGWALCWVFFSMVGNSLMESAKALPAAALVLAVGAVCLLITCIGAGRNVLGISANQLVACMGAGGLAVACSFTLWLKALGRLSLVSAAGLWYLGVLFVAVADYFLEGLTPGWLTLGGAILILLGVRGGLRHKPRADTTIGDIIRGSWGEQ